MIPDALRIAYGHELLSEADLQIIAKAHRQVHFSKGDRLLGTGSIANGYWVLKTGLIRSYVNDYSGKDITTNFFTENDIVIEVASLFQRIPSQENLEALVDCSCWYIDFKAFQDRFHSMEGFREWGRAWMANSLFEFKQRSVTMITDSASERYTRLLQQKPAVFQHAPLKHIASYLGVTDTSLSRIRKGAARS